MLFSLISVLAAASTVQATATDKSASPAWTLKQFKNLVVFGDSYSDESRLGYFINHKGAAPPPGLRLNESYSTADGGRVWGRYVVQYTGANQGGKFVPTVDLDDRAVSGAVCSNKESPRYFGAINAPFPDLDGYEVPSFFADAAVKGYRKTALTKDNAIYAIFDGTNDIGVGAYLTDSQIPGNNLVSYLNCIYTQVDRLYEFGARHFVLFNLVPLDLAPIYANASAGGGKPDQYWPERPSNITAISLKVNEFVGLVNEAYRTRTAYDTTIAKRWPGAKVVNFDVHSLVLDIYNHPQQYLNGTAPANVTGTVHTCSNANCTAFTTSPSPDSFVWYDSLHISEQVERIIAKEFISTLSGKGKYAKYYS